MNDGNPQLTDIELNQFIDGELSEARSREIALIVAGDPQLGKKIERYHEADRRLGDYYDAGRSEPIPPRFLMAVSGDSGTRVWRAAAALLWLLAGGVIGYTLQNPAEQVVSIRPLPTGCSPSLLMGGCCPVPASSRALAIWSKPDMTMFN